MMAWCLNLAVPSSRLKEVTCWYIKCTISSCFLCSSTEVCNSSKSQTVATPNMASIINPPALIKHLLLFAFGKYHFNVAKLSSKNHNANSTCCSPVGFVRQVIAFAWFKSSCSVVIASSNAVKSYCTTLQQSLAKITSCYYTKSTLWFIGVLINSSPIVHTSIL